MKKFSLLLISFLLLASCNSSQVANSDPSSKIDQQVTSKNYQSTELGLSFTYPTHWTQSTNEGGDLYIYRDSPYETVTFVSFKTKDDWLKAKTNGAFSLSKNTNVSTQTTVGGYPATLITTIVIALDKTFSGYFVDTGSKWFEIDISDPNSNEILKIIESLKF